MKKNYQFGLLIAVLFLGCTFFFSSALAATSRNDGLLQAPAGIYPNIKGNVESVGSPFLGAPLETGTSADVAPADTIQADTKPITNMVSEGNPWVVRLILFGLVIIGSIFILWKFRK